MTTAVAEPIPSSLATSHVKSPWCFVAFTTLIFSTLVVVMSVILVTIEISLLLDICTPLINHTRVLLDPPTALHVRLTAVPCSTKYFPLSKETVPFGEIERTVTNM